jgi:hypothetical protein
MLEKLRDIFEKFKENWIFYLIVFVICLGGLVWLAGTVVRWIYGNPVGMLTICVLALFCYFVFIFRKKRRELIIETDVIKMCQFIKLITAALAQVITYIFIFFLLTAALYSIWHNPFLWMCQLMGFPAGLMGMKYPFFSIGNPLIKIFLYLVISLGCLFLADLVEHIYQIHGYLSKKQNNKKNETHESATR